MIPNTPYEPSGSWDSIHVFETAERGRQAHYKLTSTVMLQLVTRKGSDNEVVDGEKKLYSGGAEKNRADGWKREGEVSLSGSMTRQVVLSDVVYVLLLISVLGRRSKIGRYRIVQRISRTQVR